MEFRWVAGLTLWTVLSGPVLVEWVVISKSLPPPRRAAAVSQVSQVTPTPPPIANDREQLPRMSR
jgi:hypothetical protein